MNSVCKFTKGQRVRVIDDDLHIVSYWRGKIGHVSDVRGSYIFVTFTYDTEHNQCWWFYEANLESLDSFATGLPR